MASPLEHTIKCRDFHTRILLGIVHATGILSSTAFENDDFIGITYRMRIISILPACFMSLFQISATSPLVQQRDAPFKSVRTRLDRDFTKSHDVEPEKYFREARFASHYDGRFADRELAYEERRVLLKGLIRTYLSTMNDIGVETFLVHGTLLGWWWNRRIMPWDDDVDVST